MGGIDGMLSFREERLIDVNRNYGLYFDKLYINNQLIFPGDDSGVLKEILPRTSQLKLNYKQNNLTFEFCSSNYSLDSNYLYEYKLENFDTNWIPLSTSTLVYTNLSSGKYVLRLRELGGTREPDHEISLHIQISPPFYFSSYAYAIYVLLAGALFAFAVRFKTKQAELRTSLEYERKEKLRIEELNQIKLSFFTNISHEFRTPLTLIIGQIEYLLQLNRLEPAVYNRLLRIYRNSWHMRDLISELLDFRKQEQGFLKLQVESKDLVAYTKEVYMSFYEYAMNRHINYRFEHLEDKVMAWFDPIQMKKVIFNLLSNAFKYTPEDGTIVVSVRRTLHEIQILVKDTGAGISPESLDKIFDRFYQSGKTSSQFTSGTGIGLSLAKGIVELHKGHIQVESQWGEGSLFTVSLPAGYAHFTDNEIQEVDKAAEMILSDDLPPDLLVPVEEKQPQPEGEEKGNKPTILIVEDNTDLLEMLADVFHPIYHVYTATDGVEGLSLVQQLQPDIVLGDVMMPNMSGKEMCYRIKNSVELSHIPVVLITAQTSVEYAIEGYMYGADDYITKPFHVKLLIARCNNLIKGRKILMERFSRKQEQIVTANAVTEQDKIFIERTMEIIRRNFDNPAFDMNMLASELNMGRSKLYIRLKEVTGFTPNEFTLKLKLDEAMDLLLHHPEYNITDIAYRLGFSSARYFSKCFKDLYGKSPQEIRRTNGKTDKPVVE
ncbi:MAG: ATP-binding protein [Bacteroides sp.]|nr:ATP-binding protein [Bacteroides sp.]